MARTLLLMVGTLLPLACKHRNQVDVMNAKVLACWDMSNDLFDV